MFGWPSGVRGAFHALPLALAVPACAATRAGTLQTIAAAAVSAVARMHDLI
jgi:hypothetical protein